MNLPLKVALVERGTPAYRTAMAIGIHPNKLSKFISGIQDPTKEEKERLANILNRAVDELFPEPHPPVVV